MLGDFVEGLRREVDGQVTGLIKGYSRRKYLD